MISKTTNDKNFCFVPVKIERAQLPAFANTKLFIDFTEYPDGPNGGDLLRLLYALVGQPLNDPVVHFAWEQDEAAGIISAKISAAIRNGRPEKLEQLFEENGLPWKTTASLACKAAEGLTKLGSNDKAIAMLEKVEVQFPKAIRPKQLKALALSRTKKEKDLDDAQEILGELYASNRLDPETMGIYARTWMDRYVKSNDINDLKQSRDLYAEAFEKAPDDYYTGINAASKSVLIGTEKDLQKAAEYAARVQKLTGTDAAPGDYWKTATVAEVLLIQKKYKEAGDMYERAVAMARSETGSHESTFIQVKRLMDKMKPAPEDRAIVVNAFGHLQVPD
jgi:tetratricopeptide (TPR) repeat protein